MRLKAVVVSLLLAPLLLSQATAPRLDRLGGFRLPKSIDRLPRLVLGKTVAWLPTQWNGQAEKGDPEKKALCERLDLALRGPKDSAVYTPLSSKACEKLASGAPLGGGGYDAKKVFATAQKEKIDYFGFILLDSVEKGSEGAQNTTTLWGKLYFVSVEKPGLLALAESLGGTAKSPKTSIAPYPTALEAATQLGAVEAPKWFVAHTK